MPECESQSIVLLILGVIVTMILGVNSSIKKPECETIRTFCGTCETVHEYIRSDSPQFKNQYANREELVEKIEKLIVNEDTGKVAHLLVDPKEAKVIVKILVNVIRTHGLEE